MASAVDSIAVVDNESTSNTLKRRRSSSTIPNETDSEPTPSKRVRSSSITTSDNPQQLQTIYTSLNEIVQSHRNLVREYLDLQMCQRPRVSIDEQRFIQNEEDLIEKVEKNLHDINHLPSTPPSRNGKRQRYQSINATNPSFDRVKNETHILKRIEELKSDGKWTNQRLAKCLEPEKRKTHWDYLLDEMRWLAEDFLLEKRWKQAMAKKISHAVLKHFREKNQLETYQQREQIRFQRRQAQFVCREVMHFWKNISKIAEDKQTARLEELRKEQVDINENFSSEDEIDDEETIEREEENEPDEYTRHELEELQADREESIDTILKRHYGIDLSLNHCQEEDNLDDSLFLTAQSFQPTGHTLQTTSVTIPVPFLLKHSLRDYQHIGLDWLVRFYDQQLNCVLADETSLGKTIQTIALLAYLACEKANWGPHLIIVPTNQILNWQIELKKWCPALKVFIDYGSIEDWTNVNTFHVYITSYKLISQNPKFFQWNQWRYLILDEIEDIHSELWQTLQSEHRLVLTNTPVESRALLQFLLPNFETCFQSQRLHPFILRRSKVDVEDQMPKKYEHILLCDLSPRQRIFYENFLSCDMTEQAHSIALIMQLKKICNHPDLIEPRSTTSPLILEKEFLRYEIPQLIFDINFQNPYLAFDCASYDTFLSYRIQFSLQPTKEMILSRMNTYTDDRDTNQERIQLTKDIIERYRNTSIWTQADEMDVEFQSEILDDEDHLSRYEFLCRINAERCQYRPLYGSDVLSQIELAMRPCHPFNRTTFSGYALCRSTDTLREFVQFNRDIFDRFVIPTTRVVASSIELFQSTHQRISRRPLIEVLSSMDFDVLTSINHSQQNQLVQFPERHLIEYDCGKLQTLAKLLSDLQSSKHRCLIYTHMMDMLGLLELFLNYHGYTYLRLDSTIDHSQRQILIERFNNDKKIFLLISSTRIGGFHVNLTGADTVIFYDSDWNSTVDAQVQDRCERMAQIKDVHIYRLVNENTIEEKINRKGLLDQWTMTETELQQAIATVEEDVDRQAAMELTKETNMESNEEKIEEQMEEELPVFDHQLQPIERYALRCVEAYRTEHPITQISSNTYLDTEQIQKDWHSSRLQALKEQEENQLDQDNDEMLYTYARNNERKIWITEDGQVFEIWCGILMKCSMEEMYNDDELDFGYESEAMIIEPEEYIRFPLPKALLDTTNMSRSDTNILVPRSLFDRSNLLLNTQSSSLSTNTLNKSKQVSNNNKILSSALSSPQANLKARQLYVNNGTTTTPLPNSSHTNVIVPASTSASSRPVKLEEMLSKDNFQGLLEIDNSDWLISEDYKVLDTIQNIQQLPLSSMSFSSTSNANKPQSILPNSSLSSSPLLPSATASSSSPTTSIVNNTTNALTQNWDFISDIVNRYSRVLRTPKQCKHRFEQVIGPREEGRVVYDLVKKKKHVIKGTVKMSDDNWQMLRTNQLFVHDNCQKLAQIYQQKFETIAQFEQQLSSMTYLNKFKQMQIAQATHHQMRGLKLGSHLQENNINVEAPLAPGDVSYQRSEREKELKQQQQQQQQQAQLTQPATASVHSQQQQQQSQPQTPTTPNSVDTMKQQTSTTNIALPPTTTTRVRPSTLNTTPTTINSSSSTPLSLIPAGSPSTPTIQRSVSSNIIVASNNHPTMNPNRSQSNILPPRANISSSTPTSISPVPSSSNQSSISTATIVPGQRQVQMLPSNSISTSEANPIQQKQVGTVQITSNDYRQVRTVPHQQQTTTPSNTTATTTNPSPTPSNLQLRTQNYQRNQAQAAALATLEVRTQLPTSPKSQQQPSRPPSTTPRTPSMAQAQADYVIQSQGKSLTPSISQPSVSVAVSRPMQQPTTSVTPTMSSSPTSPLNLPSLNVTLPPNKLTTTITTAANPNQPLRTATTFLPNQAQSSTQTQQIRQLFTSANNPPQQTNTQRLTEATQRPPSNIQQIIASRAPLSGQVRNFRIVTFTQGANPPAGITDSTTTANPTSTSLTYNRSNSSTPTISRSTINIDQDISPDLAAQLHRLKSFNVTTTDPNDATQTPRAVLVPARTIPGASTSSASSAGAGSKIKASALIDPTTLGFTAKTSQANIILQLPSTTTTVASGDDQMTTNTTNSMRQNLLQHLNIVPSTLNQRSQSPTTITTNPTTVNRLLQQYQIRATLNPSASQVSSGQLNNEQLASASPPPPPPSSSSSSTT